MINKIKNKMKNNKNKYFFKNVKIFEKFRSNRLKIFKLQKKKKKINQTKYRKGKFTHTLNSR